MDWNELKGSLTSISDAEQAAMKHVGTLVMRRKELGYSQRTLAEMVEMPQSSIARIEALEVIPTLTTVSRLCEALELTMVLKPTTQGGTP